MPHCRDARGTMSVSVMAYRCAKTLIHTTVCSTSDRVSSDILQRDQLCADVVSRTQCPTRCVSEPTFVARRAAFATQRQLPYEQLRKRWGPGCSVLLALRHGLCVRGEGLRETPETPPSGGLGLQKSIPPIAQFFNRLYVVCGFMTLPGRNPRRF